MLCSYFLLTIPPHYNALINVLVWYLNLKKSIGPAPGDKVSGKTKITHYRDVAERLLDDQELYSTLVKTAAGRKA